MFKLRKIVTVLIAIVLFIGVLIEEPIAFFLLGFWSALIAFAIYKKYPRLLNVVAPEFPLERVKEDGTLSRHIWAGFIFALIFFLLGTLVSIP